MKPDLNIGMVGHMFMGRAHSQAWSTIGRAFDLPLRPRMRAICGPDRADVEAAAERLGWDAAETDWHALVRRPDIDVVDICAPGALHAAIATEALEAGKHVVCEKPMANSVAEARVMVAAAEKASAAGICSMVAYNYRRVPALALARGLILDDRLGTIRHVRAAYLQDWLVDPMLPLNWRMTAAASGSGAVGDIGSHIVDLSQYLLGDRIESVCGITETFVKERPLPDRSAWAASGLADDLASGAVTVPDSAAFLARFAGGAVGTFEATRMATGRRNSLRVEVNGSKGSIAFDLERLDELQFYDGQDPRPEQGFRRILVTEPMHPWLIGWWPPGHIIGWEHTFANELRDFVEAVATRTAPRPSFSDGLQVEEVLDALMRSASGAGWVAVGDTLRSQPAGDPPHPADIV